MKKIYLTILLTSLFTTHLFSQSFQWINRVSGAYSDQAYAIDVDSYGNSYSTGNFYGNAIAFDTIVLNFGGSASDMWVAKFNSHGDVQWALPFDCYQSTGNGIVHDEVTGATYVTGYFNGNNCMLDTVAVSSDNYTEDFYLAKINSNGRVEWIETCKGTGNAAGEDLGIDSDGNIVVTGNFSSIAVFGTDTIASSSLYENDIFVAKYSPLGARSWLKHIRGTQTDHVYGIGADAYGNTIITGNFSDSAIFENDTVVTDHYSYIDLFTAKFDANGIEQWVKKGGAGSSYVEASFDVAVKDDGTSFIVGKIQSTAQFGSLSITSNGGYDWFLVEYDGNGNEMNAHVFGGSAGTESALGVDIGEDGRIYVTGSFSGSTDMGGYVATSAGNNDIFVAYLDANGVVERIKTAGGTSSDNGFDLAVNNDLELFLAGGFTANANFDNTVFTYDQGNDIYIAKLSCTQPYISSTISDTLCGNGYTYLIANSVYNGSYYWYRNDTLQMFSTSPNLYVNSAGNFSYVAMDGLCLDTSDYYTIEHISAYYADDTLAICSGDSSWLENDWQINQGTYIDTLLSVIGCDSIVSTFLFVHNTYQLNTSFSICAGDSVLLANEWQTSAGVYSDTLSSVYGCDSIIHSELIINDPYIINQSLTICNGDSLNVGPNYYTETGIYTDSLFSVFGCDSVVVTDLSVYDIDTTVTINNFTLTSIQSGSTFQWFDCSSQTSIAGETNSSFTATYNGDFAVEITSNGCVDTSSCISIDGVIISEQISVDVKVYPNPSSGTVYIESNATNSILNVFTIEGKLLTTCFLNANGEVKLNQGVYVFEIVSDKNRLFHKVIIQ